MPTQSSSSATAQSPSSTFPGSSRSWTAWPPARASSRSASSRPRSRSSQLPQRRRAAATSSSPARALPTVTCLSRTPTTSTPRTSTTSSPLEWRVPGEPVVFTLGIGPWISVGWNEAGLSITGNELTPNDERVGIPAAAPDARRPHPPHPRGRRRGRAAPGARLVLQLGLRPSGGGRAERRGLRHELRRRPPRRRRDPRAYEPLRQRGHAEVRELRTTSPARASASSARASSGRAGRSRSTRSARPSPTMKTRQTPSAGTATPPRT